MLKQRQKTTIKLLDNWVEPCNPVYASYYFPQYKQNVTGESPEKCFFDYTEKGIKRGLTTNKQRLVELLFAHQNFALDKTNWYAAFKAGILHPSDFQSSPLEIQKEAKKVCNKTRRVWNVDTTKNLLYR